MTARTTPQPFLRPSNLRYVWLALAPILIVAGVLGVRSGDSMYPKVPFVDPWNHPIAIDALLPGSVATLDSPLFTYSPGWTVTNKGADPGEPADPWTEPAGVVTFEYSGEDLLLELALGDYWGYLYVTVDGEPANHLPLLRGNLNSEGAPAGYRTFYAPEWPVHDIPYMQWVLVHRAPDSGQSQVHQVRIEVWRSWGQLPLRGVAVDAQAPPEFPRWIYTLSCVAGFALLIIALRAFNLSARRIPGVQLLGNVLAWLTHPMHAPRPRQILALAGMLLIAAAIALQLWWLGPLGLAMLGYASLRQPALWAAALLFALPFYYSQTLPILPGRAINLTDVGVLGGLFIACGAWFIAHRAPTAPTASSRWPIVIWISVLMGWALVAVSDAFYAYFAMREWLTVFVAATLFALLLTTCHRDKDAPWLLLGAWIAGGVVIALIGLGQFTTDAMLIEAEGVHRVRSLYGSPNNLALYLERTLMPTLAFLLLLPNGTRRWLALAAAAIQGGVLLLTFSKGALILGLPAGFVTLWLGGLYVLRRQRASTRPLWWLAAAAGVAIIALLPFLGTERFQRLLDFDAGTGFTRLQLWRSAWQMALDHWWLGVGPDNFLYAYRSQYILPAAWQEPNLNHPHTWLLDWWTRLGVVGMILGMGWWITGLRATWQRLRHPTSTLHAALWLGTFAAMIAALSHGLIDLSYAVPDLMLVWVLLTMLPTMDASSTASAQETSPSPLV